MFEEKKQEIDTAFEQAGESAKKFHEDLMALRGIEFPELEGLTVEEKNEIIKMGRDLDMRTAFLLRSLLVQHGNVLWL